MGGGSRGEDIDWVRNGHQLFAAWVAKYRARSRALDSSEAMLKAAGMPCPPRPKWYVLLWQDLKELLQRKLNERV
jgi:hypothetical protein